MKSTLKKILLFALILGVIIVIAVFVFGNKGTDKSLNTPVSTTTQNPISGQSQKFLQSLSQVKSITLDTTFFSDPAYLKLQDFTQPIILEDTRLIGRPNPFAPLGVDTIFNEPEPTTTNTGQTPLPTNTQPKR
jgi:hypothetical protein